MLRISAVVLAFGAGCSSPAQKFHADATRRALQRQEIVDPTLPRATYRKGQLKNGDPIHFYLDGDGTPWVRGNRVAADPTARQRLILELISADPAPSLLIGRPCYYQTVPQCDASWWTARRYAPEVVEAIAATINDTIQRYPNSPIVVIGYSGGGTLAFLAAPALVRVDVLITVAANLDVEAWAAHHNYTPLTGSLSPASQPPLDSAIRQFHYYGSEDDIVPAALARHVVERQPKVKSCAGENDWNDRGT